MSATIGSLCSGYGGLDLAVETVTGARTAWVSDIDPGARKVLAHRFPDAPNLGDMTAVQWLPICGEAEEFPGCGRPMPVASDRKGWVCDPCQQYWSTPIGRVYWPHVPEPVDVLTGGTPCQDLSHAGKRAGMTEGTRSNLWVAMREAIAALRPSLVVWENVAGAYSAEAASELESNPRLLADTRHRGGPVLRALGRVVGDLASLGYVGGWHGLRAADVGYAHGRLRVFVVAWPADADPLSGGRDGWARDPIGSTLGGTAAPGGSEGARLLPTPRTSDTNGAGHHGEGGLDLRNAVTLLPTPAVNDMGAAYTPETWDAWTARMKAEHDNGNGHGKSLNVEVQRLLPTPKTEMHTRTSARDREVYSSGDSMGDVVANDAWGDYTDAIARHAHTLGRPAPEPTETGPRGNPRLSCRFDEWLMGLPAGWITNVPGITHRETLRLCGNGVVPGQAAAGIRHVLAGSHVLGGAA